MNQFRIVNICDAASKLGGEPPKHFVVLDAAICRDTLAEMFYDELPDSEEEAVM